MHPIISRTALGAWCCGLFVAAVAVLCLHVTGARAATPAAPEAAPAPKAQPTVTVTCSWDDGHRNDVRLTELLRAHGARATFYIYPENYVLYLKDPEAGLKKDPFLTVPHDRFVAAYAGMEVGAHGFEHLDMTKLSPEALTYQLTESKRVLEAWFGRPVTGMAYPYGANNAAVREAVKKAGYLHARAGMKKAAIAPIADPYALEVSLHFKDKAFWDEFARVKTAGGIFHFWGHSHEIATEEQWKEFEERLVRLQADASVRWATNGELFRQ